MLALIFSTLIFRRANSCAAAPEPDLARALPDVIPGLTTELWIVTHSDLKRTARVRAFFDHIGDGLARQLFEGAASSNTGGILTEG